MSITKLPDGLWFVDVEPIKGKRFRKRFKTKTEAQRFEATVRQKCIENPDWSPKPKDRRRLSELVDRWAVLHGHALSDGENRKRLLIQLAKDLGDPVASQLTGHMYAEYRAQQISKGANGKTLNNRLGYLRAVFNELLQLGDIDFANPLQRVKPLKLQERELTWLTEEQIRTLFGAIRKRCKTPHVEMVARVCLATGARWGEAEGLSPTRIRGGCVTFVNTKSKRARSVPIDSDLEAALKDHFIKHGMFSNCRNSFDQTIKGCIALPPGQASHVLRHTFASHFMMNGGNILTLQKILGHTSLAMTMRYAHLSPDHLQDAVRFNPMRKLNTLWQ
ncbi:phage integrase [Pseudomonas panipatensis]|uniref:Site-specific recombinase XerD n=1 Tax=Pseudomonas panipatensis TaxID=428992 RepID=A0A1G8GMT9_9PSED|nr:tyrosine-type recombinase/integrase [Pseudomonas panipatensis]SDH95748.1 Site-specific recombinase XerD [Pseudomonas panipatensis]SMP42423.1 Site-specific recombinase XerD [Pseudomonas panipatensis]